MRKSKAIKRDSKRSLRRKNNEILFDFIKKLESKDGDCPSEFQKTVDKHFWELA